MTNDLTAFITARLNEDERYLKSNRHHLWTERPLREVAAKRAILALHKPNSRVIDQWTRCYRCNDSNGDYRPYPCPEVRLLAPIWSDHPDYRQEWAPECCDLHGRNCEPPSELCCENCTEARPSIERIERNTALSKNTIRKA